MKNNIYLNRLGIVNALGSNCREVLHNLFAANQGGFRQTDKLLTRVAGAEGGNVSWVAPVDIDLPTIPGSMSVHASRNNQVALAALQQIENDIKQAIKKYGKDRISIVVGSSTSGILEGEEAIAQSLKQGNFPDNYHYRQQEIGAPSEFIKEYYDIAGPSFTISTACSSSAKAFASAKNLLAMDVCDVVIVGGVDTLCRLTVSGFNALESISDNITNPFSVNRQGITIGEGAAFFLVSKEPTSIELLGCGDSSDAFHISAPQPEGEGAEHAIRNAMADADIVANEVNYINLHGTGTRKNDAMESMVTNRVFGLDVPVSSSKSQIGHTLGASGANEVALCWLALSDNNKNNLLPPHCWDKQVDPDLLPINLVRSNTEFSGVGKQIFMSNSFAFGGNNACVIIGRDYNNSKNIL